MAGVNKVILLGNLGKDPESRTFDNGRKKVSFTLATSERYKDRTGQMVEATEWHNIVVWGPAADVAEKYLRKGSQVFLEGKIRTRSYDGTDGQKKYITEIEVQNLTLVGGRQGGDNNGNQGGADAYSNDYMGNNATANVADDDLPF